MIPHPASAAVALHPAPRGTPARKRRQPYLLLLGLVMVFGPGGLQLLRLSAIQWRLNRRVAALSAHREQLQREQQRLQSDPTYIEGLIRSTFKVARPGEYVILPDPEDRNR